MSSVVHSRGGRTSRSRRCNAGLVLSLRHAASSSTGRSRNAPIDRNTTPSGCSVAAEAGTKAQTDPGTDQYQHRVHLRDVLDISGRCPRNGEEADQQLVEVTRLHRRILDHVLAVQVVQRQLPGDVDAVDGLRVAQRSAVRARADGTRFRGVSNGGLAMPRSSSPVISPSIWTAETISRSSSFTSGSCSRALSSRRGRTACADVALWKPMTTVPRSPAGTRLTVSAAPSASCRIRRASAAKMLPRPG